MYSYVTDGAAVALTVTLCFVHVLVSEACTALLNQLGDCVRVKEADHDTAPRHEQAAAAVDGEEEAQVAGARAVCHVHARHVWVDMRQQIHRGRVACARARARARGPVRDKCAQGAAAQGAQQHRVVSALHQGELGHSAVRPAARPSLRLPSRPPARHCRRHNFC